MGELNILFVDDDTEIADNLAMIFNRREGFQATAKYHGKDALEEIKRKVEEENPYDIVICDLIMPEIDGKDVLKEALFIDPSLCFVMLTGYGSIGTATQLMDMGAYFYFEKPLNKSIDENLALLKRGVAEKRIAKIRRVLLETKDESYIIDLIINAMETLFNPREYFLAVITQENEKFEILKHGRGINNKQGLKDKGFVKQLLRTKKRIVELSIDDKKREELNPFFSDTSSLLAEPLIIHDNLIGILTLESKDINAFSFFDQKIISELADVAALAFNNTRYLKEKNQWNKVTEQKELIENINHKIKTPLWNIIGRVELIKNTFESSLPDRVKEYIDEIWENAKKVKKLSKSLFTANIKKCGFSNFS